MITLPRFYPSAAFGLMAFFAVACSTTSSATLTRGMTPDQTIQAMGQPDLRDNIADPDHSGASVLRYVWLSPGKAAIFSSDNHLASIQNVESNTKDRVEQEAAAAPHEFDPIATPLGYLFFPIKAGLTYLGAGANCIGGGGCHKPKLPSPSAG